MSIVENIRSRCKLVNISIPKLEKELGFGNGAIYNWDRNSPSFDKLQKVAEYFKVSTDYLVFGFNRSLLASTVALIKNMRTFEQFAEDTGVDKDELCEILAGSAGAPPSLETIEKIAADSTANKLVSRDQVLIAAGYDPTEIPAPAESCTTSDFLSRKEERDIAHDLKNILFQLENDDIIAFYDNTLMDNDSKELLRISLENLMRLAKHLTKRKVR